MDIDYMPLHDIFRSLYGFNKLNPTQDEFDGTLELMRILLGENNIVCLVGPDMIPTEKSIPELISFLQTKFADQKYEEINYGIWFDKRKKG
jgi:hypothetical protein